MKLVMNGLPALPAIVLGLALAAPAAAQPQQARRLRVDMVTAYEPCGASNTVHRPALQMNACTLPVLSTSVNPASVTVFGPAGRMSAQLQALQGDVRVRVKGIDIVTNGGPANGMLTARLILRITDNACGPLFDTSCTVTDFGMPFAVTCTSGKCSTKTTVNTLIPDSFHVGDRDNVEVSITIEDADADPAFRMGLLIP